MTRARRIHHSGGWLVLDALIAILLLVVAFAAVALTAIKERDLVNDARRAAAFDAVLTGQLERVRATPFDALRVGRDQPAAIDGLDWRLRGAECFLDVERYRPETPDLLKVTVRVLWHPPRSRRGEMVERSRMTLVARRRYGEGPAAPAASRPAVTARPVEEALR